MSTQVGVGAEMEIRTLLGELYRSYISTDAPGELSLLARLQER
ncbi:hypothetical protein [Protofrankia symbiont of Coriaria ruscifolia]|nr:hypothetical protein [Protofrankia symbiont of Coriaria ruscifolia]